MEVDQLGLIPATRLAMLRAIDELPIQPDQLLIDHISLPDVPIPQESITRGDSQVLSIASASIIAKVRRDDTMMELDQSFPGYGFAAHKGYGTPQHRTALQQLAPCPIHRFSYSPIATQMLEELSTPSDG
jgi:ribonuclease HII